MLHNRELLLKTMELRGMDAIVAAKPENTIYLTDFHVIGSRTIKKRLSYVIYFRSREIEPVALIPFIDLGHFRDISWIPRDNVYPFTEFPTDKDDGIVTDKFAFIHRAIAERGLAGGVVGIELDFLPAGIVECFKSALPEAKIVDASEVLSVARSVKTSDEIDRLRWAAKATEAGCYKLMEMAAKESTEMEAIIAARTASMAEGAETVGFSAVGGGPRSYMPHNNARNERIVHGEVFHFDYGVLYDAYWGDLARSYVFGKKPTAEAQRVYDVVLATQQAGVKAVKPGVRAMDIFEAAVREGKKLDPTLRREHVGHGLGLEVHEEPLLIKDNEMVMQAGMVICVEVSRHVPGVGGFQVEDTLIVTGDGYEVLSTMPRTLYLDM